MDRSRPGGAPPGSCGRPTSGGPCASHRSPPPGRRRSVEESGPDASAWVRGPQPLRPRSGAGTRRRSLLRSLAGGTPRPRSRRCAPARAGPPVRHVSGHHTRDSRTLGSTRVAASRSSHPKRHLTSANSGAGRTRTSDRRIMSLFEHEPLTCGNGPKPAVARHFGYSPVLVVAHRFAVVHGTQTGHNLLWGTLHYCAASAPLARICATTSCAGWFEDLGFSNVRTVISSGRSYLIAGHQP